MTFRSVTIGSGHFVTFAVPSVAHCIYVSDPPTIEWQKKQIAKTNGVELMETEALRLS